MIYKKNQIKYVPIFNLSSINLNNMSNTELIEFILDTEFKSNYIKLTPKITPIQMKNVLLSLNDDKLYVLPSTVVKVKTLAD